MPNPNLPSATEMFANLTVEELVAARDFIVAAEDEDALLAPIWAAIEFRLAELGA